MSEIHEGGCVCAAVRYRVTGAPLRTTVCHCKFCQRRTGSAFGIGVYFRQESVEIVRGLLQAYLHRSDESGRWLRTEFCGICGTTVGWTLELLPGARSIAGGTFDDPDWFRIERHGWTQSAQHWVVLPADVQTFPRGTLQPEKK